MKLKDLIAYLSLKDELAPAVNGFGAPHSYRGWYDQVAFEPVAFTTAGEMLEHAKSALNKEFTGWKGGTYLMTSESFVNIAMEGDCGREDDITVDRLDRMFSKESYRTPLSKEIIDRDFMGRVDFVRRVEAAHGIRHT